MSATMISAALWLSCVLCLCCGAPSNETSTARPGPTQKAPPTDQASIRIVTVSSVTSSGANVTWTSHGVDGEFVVKLERVGDANVSKVVETNSSFLRMGDLEAWTPYRVEVTGRRNGTNASVGAEVQFRTEAAAPSPPRQLEVVNVDSTSVTLRWQPPEKFRGPLKGYTVFYGRWDDVRLRSAVRVRTPNVTIANLTPNTRLAVYVKATNALSNGSEVASDPVTAEATTHIAAPTKVQRLHLVSVGITFADVEWSPPAKANGPLDGYLVYSCVEPAAGSRNAQSECRTIHLPNKTSCRVEHMTPDTRYSIFVTAFNHPTNGTGTLLGDAERISVHTLQEPPASVGEIRVKSLSAGSIDVSWEASYDVDGYVVAWCQNHSCVEKSTNETGVEIAGLHPSSDYNISVDPYRFDSRGNKLFGPLRTVHVTLAAIEGAHPKYLAATLICIPLVVLLAAAAVYLWKHPWKRMPGIYKRMSSLEQEDDDILFMKTVPSK